MKHGGKLKEKDILNLFENIKPNSIEIMCHPGYADNVFYEKYSHWDYNPEEEFNVLISEKINDEIKKMGIQLVY